MKLDEDAKAFGDIDNSGEWLDLRLGNPMFLRKYWERVEEMDKWRVKSKKVDAINFGKRAGMSAGMEYCKQMVPEDIAYYTKALHLKFMNCKLPPFREYQNYIAHGHGAVQMLLAGIYALKTDETLFLAAEEPYWPRFKALAELS